MKFKIEIEAKTVEEAKELFEAALNMSAKLKALNCSVNANDLDEVRTP